LRFHAKILFIDGFHGQAANRTTTLANIRTVPTCDGVEYSATVPSNYDGQMAVDPEPSRR